MSEEHRIQSLDTSCTRGSEIPRLTPEFVENWLQCLHATLGHPIDFPFACVRTFSGATRRVCVPLLPYAQFDAGEAARLLARQQDRRGRQIRHLAPVPGSTPAGTPVVSAIPLFEWRNAEHFWSEALTSNLRKKIRKASKDGYVVERSCGLPAVDCFHALFCSTMHRHGTPPYPRSLFREAIARCGGEVVIVRHQGQAVVAYYTLHDKQAALFMWAGFKPDEDAGYASLMGEWEAIKSAFERGCQWFDLGRAPFGGPAWRHKQYWHPRHFHATSTPAASGNVYAKYAFASRAWRRLPAALARTLGPWIASHLPDA